MTKFQALLLQIWIMRAAARRDDPLFFPPTAYQGVQLERAIDRLIEAAIQREFPTECYGRDASPEALQGICSGDMETEAGTADMVLREIAAHTRPKVKLGKTGRRVARDRPENNRFPGRDRPR